MLFQEWWETVMGPPKKEKEKMTECYYKNCPMHSKDEPFCTQDKCNADEDELIVFEQEREEELRKDAHWDQ